MSNGADKIGELRVPIYFSAIAAIALALLTVWFWYGAQPTREALVFFLAGAAAVGQVAASFYTARTLAATLRKDERDAHREEAAQERQNASDARQEMRLSYELRLAAMRYGERWNDPQMFPALESL